MKLGKSKIFLLLCLAFIVGVFLGKYLNYYLMAALAMFFTILITVFGLSASAGTKKWVVLVGFLGLLVLGGALRFKTDRVPRQENFIGKLYGQKLELSGVVVKEPDTRSDKTNLTLRPEGYSGKVLLSIGRYPGYQYGDRLKFSGKLEEPFDRLPGSKPGSSDFSYKNYLSRYDVYGLMRFPKIEKLASGKGNPVQAALLLVKRKYLEVISQILPEPASGLLLGIILGAKRALPPDLKNALTTVGVSHIIVISGYNISIITRSLLKTRALWGRKVAFILSVITILAFVILTGAEASVVRAAVMGLLLVLALNIGRIYQVGNALVFTAAMMILFNPKILNFDVGFQLSFLATLGLVFLAPLFEKWLQFLPDILGFRSNLASTLAAQIFTLPLLIYYFDRISLIAPLVNVLILWTIPYLTFFGLLLGVVGMIYLPLAKVLGAVAWLLLAYQIRVVEFFSHLPLAAVGAAIQPVAITVYYLVLAAALTFYRHQKKFYYYLEYVQTKI